MLGQEIDGIGGTANSIKERKSLGTIKSFFKPETIFNNFPRLNQRLWGLITSKARF
jgi:hypothetical protein